MEKIDEELKQILLECKRATRLELSRIATETVTYLKEQQAKVGGGGIPEDSELFIMINTLSDVSIVSAVEDVGIVTKEVPVGQMASSRQQVPDLIKDFKESANSLLNKTLTGVPKDIALGMWKLGTVLQSLVINIELSLKD